MQVFAQRQIDAILGMNARSRQFTNTLFVTTKRDHIIRATRDLLFEHGLQDTSMAQIAQRAGVGMGTIYNYFANKEELVFTLYSEIKAAMSEFALESYDEIEPVVKRFLHILVRYAQYGVLHPREFRLSQQLGQVAFVQARAGEYPVTAAVERLFSTANEQHLLKEMPQGVMILLMFGGLNALVEAYAARQIRLDDALIEKAAFACWDAVRR